MFYCERCNAQFGQTVATVAQKCPRCLSAEGVETTLRYRLFAPEAVRAVGIKPKPAVSGSVERPRRADRLVV